MCGGPFAAADEYELFLGARLVIPCRSIVPAGELALSYLPVVVVGHLVPFVWPAADRCLRRRPALRASSSGPPARAGGTDPPFSRRRCLPRSQTSLKILSTAIRVAWVAARPPSADRRGDPHSPHRPKAQVRPVRGLPAGTPPAFGRGDPQSTHRTPLLDGQTLPAAALATPRVDGTPVTPPLYIRTTSHKDRKGTRTWRGSPRRRGVPSWPA
jgi:hypothetical protein